MKKTAFGLALFWFAAEAGFSQYYFDYPTFKRFEVGLHLGATRPAFMGGTIYEDTWSASLLTYVHEQTLISTNRGWTASPEVFAAWNFSPVLGIRVSLGGISTRIPSRSDVDMTWTWADRRQIHKMIAWTGTGRLTTVPVGLNIVARKVNFISTWYVTAGLTFSWNSFSADSSFGFGVLNISNDPGFQYVDALRIPLKIPKSTWRSLGANVGVGTTFALSDSLGLGADIGYFYFAKKEFSWSFVYGSYDGVFYGELKSQRFAPEDGDYILSGNRMSKVDVNLTRLRVGLFLVLSFGSAR